jgi:fructoselysine 6-phosphate deglycase
MACEFDRREFQEDLEGALKAKTEAATLGAELAKMGFSRVFLVGCGAPNRVMSVIKYWMEMHARHLEIYLYYPAELVNQAPPKLDEHALVVIASHSGTTPEILRAADFVAQHPCVSVGVTQKTESPFAKKVKYLLTYGETKQGYFAIYILLQALLGPIMKELEQWKLQDALSKALDRLPEVLADTSLANETRAAEEARFCRDEKIFYLYGSGPMFATAYVFGVCVLMEQLWEHAFPGEGAEFFHGPLEIVDENSTILLLLGEDPSRPEVERIVRFCKKLTGRLIIYDSKEFEMKGVPEEIRPIFAPFVIQAALDRIAAHLSVFHNHPLTTRRYMWRMEY